MRTTLLLPVLILGTVKLCADINPGLPAEGLWEIWGDFGNVTGRVFSTEGVFAVTSDPVCVETTVETDRAGVSWRRTQVRNVSASPVTLRGAFDRFPLGGGAFEVYSQSSCWINESMGGWSRLTTGMELRSSGMRTAFGATPVVALWNGQTSRGRVYHLIVDSAWAMHVRNEADLCGAMSVSVETGLDERRLALTLSPGEAVALPEVVSFDFENRLDLDCHKLHAWWNRHYPAKEMPSVYNTWLYRFDKFDAEGVIRQIGPAKELGCDYFVLDAGWFGPKGAWDRLRGDWEECPDGLLSGRMMEISERVRAAGMKFGFWMEVETANAGAKTVKEHPDWHRFDRGVYFLDFANPAARAHIVARTVSLLRQYKASFIKQDFNMDSAFDASGRAFVDHHRGYAAYLADVRRQCPDVFIECCAGGGMRMDLGRARLFDSFWPSDNQSVTHGMRIVRESMLRMPPRMLERWIVAKTLSRGQPDSFGRDLMLFGSDDGGWTSGRQIYRPQVEGFVLGGAVCFSCDLTAFSADDFAWMKGLVARNHAEQAFWGKAVGRILAETENMFVSQFSDEAFDEVRVLVSSERSMQNKLTVYPVLDRTAAYEVQGKVVSAVQMAQEGLSVPMPYNGSCNVITLKKMK